MSRLAARRMTIHNFTSNSFTLMFKWVNMNMLNSSIFIMLMSKHSFYHKTGTSYKSVVYTSGILYYFFIAIHAINTIERYLLSQLACLANIHLKCLMVILVSACLATLISDK